MPPLDCRLPQSGTYPPASPVLWISEGSFVGAVDTYGPGAASEHADCQVALLQVARDARGSMVAIDQHCCVGREVFSLRIGPRGTMGMTFQPPPPAAPGPLQGLAPLPQ